MQFTFMRRLTMKSRYVSAAALVAAVGAAAAAPAGAAAAPVFGPRLITIHAQPNPIVAGTPVVIFGRLRSRRDADRLVVLYRRGPGGVSGFVPVQTTHTDSVGDYEFARADGRVDSNRSWYVAAGGAVSRVVNERVASLVTLSATGPGGVSEPDGSVLQTGRGFRYTFAGSAVPGAPGDVVLLQRQSASSGDDSWRTIGRGTLDSTGAFSIVHTFVVPSTNGGDANIRVFVRRTVRNIGSPSEPISYEIEQAQNPALTIMPSAYVIPEGSSDTITGVDAAGAGQLLTLYAHDARDLFQPIATTVSGTGGAYSFPVTPAFSTYYQVSSSVASSGATGSTGITGTSGTTGTTGSTGSTGASGSTGSSGATGASGSSGASGSTGSTGATGSRGRRATSSAVAFVGVRAVLTVHTTPTTIDQGHSVTFNGTVFPDESGRNIYLERESADGNWYAVAVGVVGPNSVYSLTATFYEVGTQNVRVAVIGGPGNQGGATPPIAITVNALPAAQLVPTQG
jgi:hypothetical protein